MPKGNGQFYLNRYFNAQVSVVFVDLYWAGIAHEPVTSIPGFKLSSFCHILVRNG
jgi:hypothetical protein